MKHSFSIFSALALGALLLSSCKGKEDNTFRDEFSVSSNLGIYQDGKQVLVFDKSKHQYYCNPKECVMRVADNDGKHQTTLKLSAMPDLNHSKVSGSVSGDMGVNGINVSGLEVIKHDSRTVWLWSKKEKVGFILPAAGIPMD